MVKVSKMVHLRRIRRTDFVLAVVAFLAVLTFETLQALMIAVVVSLLALVGRASHPRLAVLGQVPGGVDFTDVRRHPENSTEPGVLIVRPENGLFFANAAGFREAIIAELGASADPVQTVLIDLGATTDLDVPSADMLRELHEELHGRDVGMMLTRVIAPVLQLLERAGALAEIGADNVFVGPNEALAAHRRDATD
jgi:MFS superfamily sulfate permease-like transporter